MATLELNGLRKSFGLIDVLHGIDLALADGEMLVIVGASGCGKSTLLRLVAGLERPTAGRVLVDGRDVTNLDPSERDIAMVFQNYALYPHMSVFDNMAYGLRIRGLARDDIRQRVDEAAGAARSRTRCWSASRGSSPAGSGSAWRWGARSCATRSCSCSTSRCPIWTPSCACTMRAEIRRLQRRLGVTSLFVTHDQVEAMTLGDRLLVLHQGRPAQLATPMEVFARPADTYVAGFIGAPTMNFLPADLARGGTAAQLDAGPAAAVRRRQAPGHRTATASPSASARSTWLPARAWSSRST